MERNGEELQREAADPSGVRYRVVVQPKVALSSPVWIAFGDDEDPGGPFLRGINRVLIRMQRWKTVPRGGAWLSVIPADDPDDDNEAVDFHDLASVTEAHEHAERIVRSIEAGTHGYGDR